MRDLIIVSGAAGSGKTTICKLLNRKLNTPYIDFGWLRQFHLKLDWSNQGKEEEALAFDNLIYIIRNYLNHGYKNVFVTDLSEERVEEMTKIFSKNDFIVASLIVNSDEELKKRVLGERDSGYRDFNNAITWNKFIRERTNLPNEHKIDNTHNDPEKTAQEIIKLL